MTLRILAQKTKKTVFLKGWIYLQLNVELVCEEDQMHTSFQPNMKQFSFYWNLIAVETSLNMQMNT